MKTTKATNLETTNPKLEEEFAAIGRWLGFETLERRFSDSLDFHECSAWSLKQALRDAYELGRRDAGKTGD